MNVQPTRFENWGRTWILLCVALGVHVADEALTDFLGWWNPMVLAVRASVPWSPLPTFRFEFWLGMLAVAVAVLLSLSPFAYRGAGWMRPLSQVFAIVMTINGFGHLSLSLYLGRPAPGVYSAPLLLVASFLLWRSLPE